MLTISFFEKQYLEWYSHSGEMSRFDKLILGVCLLHPVFLSDVLSDVIGVISKYSADGGHALKSRLVFARAVCWPRTHLPQAWIGCWTGLLNLARLVWRFARAPSLIWILLTMSLSLLN